MDDVVFGIISTLCHKSRLSLEHKLKTTVSVKILKDANPKTQIFLRNSITKRNLYILENLIQLTYIGVSSTVYDRNNDKINLTTLSFKQKLNILYFR